MLNGLQHQFQPIILDPQSLAFTVQGRLTSRNMNEHFLNGVE